MKSIDNKYKARLFYFSQTDKICQYLNEVGIDTELYEDGDTLKIDNIEISDILIFNYCSENYLLSKYLKLLHSHYYINRIMIFATIADTDKLLELYPNFDYLIKDPAFCKHNLKLIQNKLHSISQQITISHLKSTFNELRNRNEIFRTVLNSSPDAIILINKKGVILGSNDYIQSTMIKQIDCYTGKNIFDLVSIGLSSLLTVHLDKAHKTGNNQIFVFKHYDFVTEYKIVPVISDSGEESFVIFTQNVTEKVYAEKALSFNSELLSAVINNLPVMVWHIDHNFDITLVAGRLSLPNKALNMLRVDGNINDLLSAYPDFLNNVRKAFDEKITYSIDKFNNSYFETFYSIVKDEIGNTKGIIGLSNDISDKVMSELKLEEERRKVKFAFNVSYDSFWELDLRTNELSVHSFDIKKSRLPIPEYISLDDFLEMVYPDDKLYLRKLFSSFADASISSTEFNYRIRSKDNKWFWIESKAAVYEFDDVKCEPKRLIGVARDVTDKIEVELEVQRSRNLFETIINSGEHYYMLFDDEMNIMAFNNLMFDHLLSFMNIYIKKGINFSTFFNENDAGIVFTEQFLSAVSGNRAKYEYNYIDYIGSDYWIEHFFDPIRSLEGNIYAVNLIAKPINERKIIEQELVNYRKTLEAILDTSPIGIVLLQNGIIKWSNHFWREMMKIKPDETELAFCDFCNDKLLCQDCISSNDVNNQSESQGFEVVIKNCEDKLIDCLVYAKTIERTDNKSEILITIVDISDKKQEQLQREKLLEANIEAERKQNEAIQLIENSARIASIGIIAGGITHEINQPLNAIRVAAEGILFWNKNNQMALPEQVTRLINKISNATIKVDDIIQHMRAYWIESAKDAATKVNLNESVRKALSLTLQRVQSHEVFLKIEETVSPLLVSANPLQLEIIINNLVINAVQSLDTSNTQNKQITIRTGICNDKPYLSVIDNGIGLPNVSIDNLFDPFFSTKKEEKGTGLGLAIVKLFSTRFGAIIKAENNSDGGATFTIIFNS